MPILISGSMISPGNKIKILFVTAIILMLGSHALLPHHHHYDSQFSHSHTLPVDSKHTHNKPDNPAHHCHAFNQLLDNGYHHKLIKLIKYQPLVAPRITECITLIPGYSLIIREIPDIPRMAKGHDHLYSLRDPPSLC